jgi:hypothetical protein
MKLSSPRQMLTAVETISSLSLMMPLSSRPSRKSRGSAESVSFSRMGRTRRISPILTGS